MNKKTTIIAVAVIVIIGGLFLVFNKRDGNRNVGLNMASDTDQSILSWLNKGKAVECEFGSEEGNVRIRTKDGKVRIDGIPYAFGGEKATPGSSITNGDWMYMWSGKKGAKMNIKEMEEIGRKFDTEEESDYSEENPSWEEYVKGWDEKEVDYDCHETRFSDEVMVPPTDVEFTDLNQAMKGLEAMSENLLKMQEGGESMNFEDINEKLEEGGFGDLMKGMTPPETIPE